APGTRIDARAVTFLASSSTHYPISLDGGADICLAGGTVRGQYDRRLDWATMHDMNNAGAAFASPTTVDGIRVDDVTDGLRPRGIGPFTIRNAWLSYIRDDCVEDDHVEGGLIDDSLFDGCYVAISERPSSAIGGQGGGQLLTIRRSLLRLEPMPGPPPRRRPLTATVTDQAASRLAEARQALAATSTAGPPSAPAARRATWRGADERPPSGSASRCSRPSRRRGNARGRRRAPPPSW